MKLSGTIFNRQGATLKAAKGCAAHDRVVALDERGSLLGEAFVEQDGYWSLSVMKPAKWLIAQLSGRQLAAVVARAATSAKIDMYYLVKLSFTSAVHGAALWLDPIALQGFPKHLISCLHCGTTPTVSLICTWQRSREHFRLMFSAGSTGFLVARLRFVPTPRASYSAKSSMSLQP